MISCVTEPKFIQLFDRQSDWRNETRWTSNLLEGKEHEAYYATHDYGKRLICVDIPESFQQIDLCADDDTEGEYHGCGDKRQITNVVTTRHGCFYVVLVGGVNLCQLESEVLTDVRGLQSLGGPSFQHTPWYTELVLADKTYHYAVAKWHPEDVVPDEL